MLCYLGVLLGVAIWRFAPRPWHPAHTVEMPHYVIQSSATESQTAEAGQALEMLYSAYTSRFEGWVPFQRAHPKLKVRLFRDRAEFRRINPGLGWAEAFYQKPYCQAYYEAAEINPCHALLHEAVHQLNEEVTGVALAQWLEEGLATYFSTSRVISNRLAVGRIDVNTYPVWWLDELAVSPHLAENLRNGSVIPLLAIITNRGGPSLTGGRWRILFLRIRSTANGRGPWCGRAGDWRRSKRRSARWRRCRWSGMIMSGGSRRRGPPVT